MSDPEMPIEANEADSQPERRDVYYSGRVQGVGFLYNASSCRGVSGSWLRPKPARRQSLPRRGRRAERTGPFFGGHYGAAWAIHSRHGGVAAASDRGLFRIYDPPLARVFGRCGRSAVSRSSRHIYDPILARAFGRAESSHRGVQLLTEVRVHLGAGSWCAFPLCGWTAVA